MEPYRILIEVKLNSGILSPEDIELAKNKIPDGFILKEKNPEISLSGKIASLVFKCNKKTESPRKSAGITLGKNPNSKNSY